MVLFLLNSCNKTEKEQNDNAHSSTDIPYQVNEEEYHVDDYILINYPQVAALEDTDLQNKINEMIKQEALLYLKDIDMVIE